MKKKPCPQPCRRVTHGHLLLENRLRLSHEGRETWHIPGVHLPVRVDPCYAGSQRLEEAPIAYLFACVQVRILTGA